MTRKQFISAITGLIAATGLLHLGASDAKEWKSTFAIDKTNKKNLGTTGRNPYFILEPGYRLHFAHGAETSVMTVLPGTKTIDGVETRVVEDREEKNGRPIEVTRDYYAIDSTTSDVYYFGEDVDIYKGGKVVSHDGGWLSGLNGAQFGLMMPGRVVAKGRFLQERAPQQGAQDLSEVVETGVKVSTPAGSFENCVHLHDTSAIERGGDHKWYAPGVGLVKDGKAVLVKIDRVSAQP